MLLLTLLSQTTHASQGSQYEAFVIHETNASQFYTQVSWAKHGIETVSITSTATLKEGFAPATREDTDIELARLREQHDRTAAIFEQELRHLRNLSIPT